MTTKNHHLRVFNCIVPAKAHALVLTNNVTLTPASYFSGWEISQFYRPADIGLFLVGITETSPGTYQFSHLGIFERYSVHTAVPGLEFTPAYVMSDPPLLSNFSNPFSFNASLGIGESLLLAYWDDNYYAENSVPSAGDAFGWFNLTRTVNGLELTDSATVFGSGIVAGSYTEVVPEPSSIAIIALTSILFALHRRRP